MKSSRSAIIGLFFDSRPLTVVRRISSFVVDSFEGQTFRRFAHIFVKVFKGLPPLTDSNPSAPVVGIFLVVRVTTSLTHSTPNIMNGGFAHTVFYGCPHMPIVTRTGMVV